MKTDVQRVTKAYGESFEKIAKEASPMLAMAWLQPVIEKYHQSGLKDEAERLQLASQEKGKNIADDMKRIEVKLEIKRDEIEKFVESLTNTDLPTSLGLIATQFIPNVDEAKKFLQEIRMQAPLQSLISVVKVDGGRLSAKAGSVEDDPEGRLHMQLAEHIRMSQVFLLPALAKLRDRYKPTADNVLDFLYESPLFVDARCELLREGVAAYFNEDFVKTIHVLVPQIEQALRNLLAVIHVPADKPVRGQSGIMDAKTMNDVLIDERVREAITENLWRYLFVLYVDRRGVNLRNRLAHGLVDPREFNRPMADQVFHSLLALSLLRKAEEAPTQEAIAS